MHIPLSPCSLSLPLFDWCCTLCYKPSPWNSAEAHQYTNRTYTNLFLIMVLQPGLLSSFQGNILPQLAKTSWISLCQSGGTCNKGTFMWCDPPQTTFAAHSPVSYNMDLSGFMFIWGCSKLEQDWSNGWYLAKSIAATSVSSWYTLFSLPGKCSHCSLCPEASAVIHPEHWAGRDGSSRRAKPAVMLLPWLGWHNNASEH